MEKLRSEGKCIYCEETVEQRKLTRHLNSHLKKNKDTSGKKYFHIKVDAAEMFLYILVSHKACVGDIDRFLRKIWLECCGHMSAFSYRDTDDHEDDCEDAEYALYPIVNSPRMGTCAYDGGQIDTKRDGIFQLKK